MRTNKISRAILLSIALLISFFVTSSVYAEDSNSRLYKISILIFKHSPADKNTAPRLIDRWTEKSFTDSIDINTLLAAPSAIPGSHYTLSRDKSYTILYNGAWITPLENNNPTTFYFHKAFKGNENVLDGLINITLKYNLDVHFQTQLLAENKIVALDESYQTPSNQLQYIDGPIYGALVLITRYDGK